MIKQETTYYDNYNIKTLSEYSEGVLVSYEEFNEQGKLILREDIDGCITKFEYDKKNRMKRNYHIDKLGNITWNFYSYSKDRMIILQRFSGHSPTIIHKMIFGPENEYGERNLIKDFFL